MYKVNLMKQYFFYILSPICPVFCGIWCALTPWILEINQI